MAPHLIASNAPVGFCLPTSNPSSLKLSHPITFLLRKSQIHPALAEEGGSKILDEQSGSKMSTIWAGGLLLRLSSLQFLFLPIPMDHFFRIQFLGESMRLTPRKELVMLSWE